MPNGLETLHHTIFDRLNRSMTRQPEENVPHPLVSLILTQLEKFHYAHLQLIDGTGKAAYDELIQKRKADAEAAPLLKKTKAATEKALLLQSTKVKMGILARGTSNAWKNEDVRYERLEGMHQHDIYPREMFRFDEVQPKNIVTRLAEASESPHQLKEVFTSEKLEEVKTTIDTATQSWRKVHFYKDIQNDADDLYRKLTEEERVALQHQLEQSQKIDILLNEDITLRICPSYEETSEQKEQNERRNACVLSGYSVDLIMNDPGGRMKERMNVSNAITRFLSQPELVVQQLEPRILTHDSTKNFFVFPKDAFTSSDHMEENFSGREIRNIFTQLKMLSDSDGRPMYTVEINPEDEYIIKNASAFYAPRYPGYHGAIRFYVMVEPVERMKYPKMAQYIIRVVPTEALESEVKNKEQKTFHELLG